MVKIWEKVKNESVIFMFRKMWAFAGNNRKNIIIYVTFTSIANLITLLPPVIFGKFINEIQENNVNSINIDFLLLLLSSFIGVHIAFWLFHGPSRIMERKNSFIVRKNYQMFLKKNILRKNLSWHASRDTGNTIDKINNASNSLFEFSDTSFIAIENFVKVFGTLIAISFFSIYISLGILLFLILPFYAMNKFDRMLIPQYAKLNTFKNKVSAKLFDALSNIVSIVILNIKKTVIKDIKKAINAPRELFVRNSKLNEWKWFSIGFVVELFVIVPLIAYVLYHYKNDYLVEIGTLTTLYMYLRNVTGVFFNVGWYYEGVIEHKVNVENIKSIEDSFSQEAGIEAKKSVFWRNGISVKDLSFKYPDTNDQRSHLSKVNLAIHKGEKIAFIGESGSGKTTFLKVIHGLYDNANAKVYFDNGEGIETNFSDIDLKTMLVPQEPELFSSSIRENVTFGLDYSDLEVMKVLDLAKFSEVLKKLPKGLNSVVNEKGVNLSGGQKQRLALARALLFSSEKEMILLDESTSSVDPKAEVQIYQNIFTEFSGKTFLASIHKMNLLKYFDRIVIFKEGKIIDQGTFESLYESNIAFKKQWDEYVKNH